jgi:hypothetical protein
MKAIYLAAALLLSAFAFTPASAAPALQPTGLSSASPLVLAQYHPHARRATRRHVRRHTAYIAGHRYRTAPHGWHRYHARPSNWRARNCILVGPVWFCP